MLRRSGFGTWLGVSTLAPRLHRSFGGFDFGVLTAIRF